MFSPWILRKVKISNQVSLNKHLQEWRNDSRISANQMTQGDVRINSNDWIDDIWAKVGMKSAMTTTSEDLQWSSSIESQWGMKHKIELFFVYKLKHNL